MKLSRIFSAAIALMAAVPTQAVGWPANFEGVMLQGFWWDSYQEDTRWSLLEERADELAPYFRLIWVPNSGQSSGGLGYAARYWFTNHNSDMGSETELTRMIDTYSARGTGIMADLVLNHRDGLNSWWEFPVETWRGTTYQIGLDGICANDEMAWASGQPKPKGANDTGENFDGARDLDHTNANVQTNCMNYSKCLLEEFGYSGYRLDMTKGYAAKFTKRYNEYARPTFCVGEYFDRSYDLLATWIDGAGWESATFDFAFKYAVNDAFASGDMSKLVWLENGVTPKPAGLIHHWYPQMAVTFIDNHDTYRDDWNRFNGNWAAANAFMICSPGTPCVFLPHWNACGDQIGRMIEARNAVGVTNTSDVRVLYYSPTCYMAEVTGLYGKLAVKIGSDWSSPDGYTNDQIYCAGEDYCIWVTTRPDPEAHPFHFPDHVYLMGNLAQGHWQTNNSVEMERHGSMFIARNVTLEASPKYGYFSFVTAQSNNEGDWDFVNSHHRYGATSSDFLLDTDTPTQAAIFPAGVNASGAYAWAINPGTYDIYFDLTSQRVTALPAGSAGHLLPEHLYVVGSLADGTWDPHIAIELEREGAVYSAKNVHLVDTWDNKSYFSLITALGKSSGDWDTVNASTRYGAADNDLPLERDVEAAVVRYSVPYDAGASKSWTIEPGHYDITVDMLTHRISLKLADETSTLLSHDHSAYDAPVYYNLQGVRVTSPVAGSFYIERRGTTARTIKY